MWLRIIFEIDRNDQSFFEVELTQCQFNPIIDTTSGGERMVKATFINLPEEKRARITAALLKEFSQYPLAKSQVARIVKNAQIARGAFYEYFDDLTDAYQYLYQQAIKTIHMGIRPDGEFDVGFFYQSVVNFVDETQNSKYRELMKLHMLQNKAALPDDAKKSAQRFLRMPAAMWSVMILSHEVISEIFADPAHRQAYLKRYKAALELIDRGMKK